MHPPPAPSSRLGPARAPVATVVAMPPPGHTTTEPRWHRARYLDPDHPRALQALELLCGVVDRAPAPTFDIRVELWIVETELPVALMHGQPRAPGLGRMVVSRGLLDTVDPRSLAAVMAHELGHAYGRHFCLGRAWLWTGWTGFLGGATAFALGWALVPASGLGAIGVVTGSVASAWLAAAWGDRVLAARDELWADRFAAQTVGATAAIRAVRRVCSLFGDRWTQGPNRWWAGFELPTPRARVRALLVWRSRRLKSAKGKQYTGLP